MTDPYFVYWKENQRLCRQEIVDNFSPLPVREVPLYSREICGLEALGKLKEFLYRDEDPSQVYFNNQPVQVRHAEKGFTLEIHLSGIPHEQIRLGKSGDELNIRIGNHRRNMVLPQSLATLQIAGAEIDGERLVIHFTENPEKQGIRSP